MLTSTVQKLRCLCGDKLTLSALKKTPISGHVSEVSSGTLGCVSCRSAYLILGGVALLVADPHEYLLNHVKGISKLIPDAEIPEQFREDFLEAKLELQGEHIEEDLEAERVNALYLMNHYLRVSDSKNDEEEWWKHKNSSVDPLMDHLIRTHWDHGPLAQIQEWLHRDSNLGDVVELGCGVGGVSRILRDRCSFYLGVDSSFASVALARHLNLNTPYPIKLRIPGDLIDGQVSRPVDIAPLASTGAIDFVVAELPASPLPTDHWDLSIALNTIDMLEVPASLPKLQHALLRAGGSAIQSCPYIWHDQIARELREELGRTEARNSASAVRALYERSGLKLTESLDHVPWLFFKHVRQLELYSVHLFKASKV
jgi:SAM-dependent methyltransferase